jgi:hypothetical protein
VQISGEHPKTTRNLQVNEAHVGGEIRMSLPARGSGTPPDCSWVSIGEPHELNAGGRPQLAMSVQP